MSNEEQHQPGDRAPATAHYEELNVFGTQTAPLSMSVKVTRCRLHRGALRGDGYGGSRSSVGLREPLSSARRAHSCAVTTKLQLAPHRRHSYRGAFLCRSLRW